MSLNTTTNGERYQTIYVYRYDYYSFEFGHGFDFPHYIGYQASLNKPYIPQEPNERNKNKLIEVIKVDTDKMKSKPIDDYFHKILFVWSDEKYKRKFNKWREWIRNFEVKEKEMILYDE